MAYLCLALAAILMLGLAGAVVWALKYQARSYEYLELLSYHKWKLSYDIWTEMEAKKGHRVALNEMYFHLGRLIGEGLVERRDLSLEESYAKYGSDCRRAEFKLTENGLKRRRLEAEKDEMIDLRALPA